MCFKLFINFINYYLSKLSLDKYMVFTKDLSIYSRSYDFVEIIAGDTSIYAVCKQLKKENYR